MLLFLCSVPLLARIQILFRNNRDVPKAALLTGLLPPRSLHEPKSMHKQMMVREGHEAWA
jgi:hypothetical protein